MVIDDCINHTIFQSHIGFTGTVEDTYFRGGILFFYSIAGIRSGRTDLGGDLFTFQIFQAFDIIVISFLQPQ
jgi:hypothetical protein